MVKFKQGIPIKKDIPVRTLPKEFGNGIAIAKVSPDSFWEDEETMQAHRHDYHFFVLQKSGVTVMEVDFKQYRTDKPTIHYQSPNQVHRALKVENIEMFMLIMSNENIPADYLNILQSISPLEPLEIGPEDLEIIEKSYNLCVDLYERTTDKLYPSLLRDSCNALIGLLISIHLKYTKSADSLSRFERINKAFFLALEQNFQTLKRPADYATKFNISVSYLNECVKNVTGFSVSYHIQQRVILEAKRLLYHSDKSVKEIAFELGYEDYPYFSRLFTKICGMSAKMFRSKNHD
ncbi:MULTISPECIES: helix-turn-helix domain-containing protein [Sphingobacterium]|nr:MULTISPECIES: helix-turn-helix domain-containing protein [Sphingobacterium]QIH34037.1 AraC family transcriptional regulator [Sphingobacterium sp. DR205]